MTIPSDEEMSKFRSKLEDKSFSEAWRQLNQGKYGNGWKSKEIERFVDEIKYERKMKNVEKGNGAKVWANWLSGIALIIAVGAIAVAIFK